VIASARRHDPAVLRETAGRHTRPGTLDGSPSAGEKSALRSYTFVGTASSTVTITTATAAAITPCWALYESADNGTGPYTIALSGGC
jgi:hypothetical protein